MFSATKVCVSIFGQILYFSPVEKCLGASLITTTTRRQVLKFQQAAFVPYQFSRCESKYIRLFLFVQYVQITSGYTDLFKEEMQHN